MNRRRWTTALCALLVAAATGGCCRSMAEKAVEAGTDGAVKIADGGVTFSGDGGSVSTGTQSLPATWPADVPLYPGAKIRVSSNAGTTQTVVFTTTDGPTKVVAFYKTSPSGYVTQLDMTGADGGLLKRAKGKNGLTVNVTKSDDGSSGVSLTVGTGPLGGSPDYCAAARTARSESCFAVASDESEGDDDEGARTAPRDAPAVGTSSSSNTRGVGRPNVSHQAIASILMAFAMGGASCSSKTSSTRSIVHRPSAVARMPVSSKASVSARSRSSARCDSTEAPSSSRAVASTRASTVFHASSDSSS